MERPNYRLQDLSVEVAELYKTFKDKNSLIVKYILFATVLAGLRLLLYYNGSTGWSALCAFVGIVVLGGAFGEYKNLVETWETICKKKEELDQVFLNHIRRNNDHSR